MNRFDDKENGKLATNYYHSLVLTINVCNDLFFTLECPAWKYSIDCSKYCQCDKKTSVGCDPITGACLCHDKYGGTDCSCHTSMLSTCKSPYYICEYDRCKCKQGSFNVSTSCSGKCSRYLFWIIY